MAISTLLPKSELRKLRNLSPEELLQIFGPEGIDEILEAIYDVLVEDCSTREVVKGRDEHGGVIDVAGPMMWLRQFTKTENYQWQSQGVEPKAPFPYRPYPPELLAGYGISADRLDWDYLDWVMSYWLKEQETYTPKTREMVTSWLAVGYITWDCQFFPSTGWVGQSETDLKAQGNIKYANILYDNQDEWLKERFPLKRGESGTLHKIEWAHGSWYRAVPQGERQLASDHPKGYFNDESAHQPAWEATKDIAKPAVRQSIHVSSAAPSRFFDLCDAGSAV